MPHTSFDVCIRGAGIVGRALALALGQAKLRVALVEPEPPKTQSQPQTQSQAARDIRAYALNHASRQLLEGLRCWPDEAAATPVAHMRVYGDAGGAVRFDAPATRTQTDPQQALNWIVDVPALEDRLGEALRYQSHVERVDSPVAAALTAICEGKFSASRDNLGVRVQAHNYPQHAIATRVRASQPHGGTASQWFLGPHILGLLPLGGAEGDSYAVVWSTAVTEADRLMALDEAAFVEEMQALIAQALSHSQPPGSLVRAGTAITTATTFTPIAKRARWPLRLAQARHWIGSMPVDKGAEASAWVLLGDAAHTVHPLAGSGLNLGLGDVAALSHILQQRPAWRSVGERRLLRQYERERKAALLPYSLATDGLQWLFWQDKPWLQSVRNWGMRGFSASPLPALTARLAQKA